jgi:hypothetical protein
MAGLTQKQRRLIGSIEEITDELALDHQALVTNLEGVELTTMLELAVRRLVSSAIVFEYTFIDELLGNRRVLRRCSRRTSGLADEALPEIQRLRS